jgi:hypothetical protein
MESVPNIPPCPACRAAWEAENRQLRWLLRENYADPATLQRMTQAEICARHLRELANGSHPQLTVTMEWLLNWELAHIQQDARTPSPGHLRGGWKRKDIFGRGVQAEVGCPFCQSGQLAEVNWLDAMVATLTAEEDPTAEARVEDLCRSHFRQVLSRVSDQELRLHLVEQYVQRLKDLLGQCQSYFTDRDTYGQAWLQALLFYWGNRG